MTGVASNFIAADVTSVVPSTTYFKDREICVYAGDDQMDKQQLETLIASASGSPVQHAGNQFLFHSYLIGRDAVCDSRTLLRIIEHSHTP